MSHLFQLSISSKNRFMLKKPEITDKKHSLIPTIMLYTLLKK